MSELLDGASDTPVNESAEVQPAAETAKKRTRKRKEPGAEEAAAPAVKRTRRKKAIAEGPVAEAAAAAVETVSAEPPVVEKTIEVEATVLQDTIDEVPAEPNLEESAVAADEPVVVETIVNEEPEVAEEPIVAEDAASESVAIVERSTVVDPVVSEDELLVIASKPSESVEQEPPAAEATPAAPLLPIKFRPAEATSASVDPSKRRRVEETERRQRRAGGSQETDGDRPFRIEPISVRASRAERDAAKKERAQAQRDQGAPIIPPDVKVFVPTSSMVTLNESEPQEEKQSTLSALRELIEPPAVSARMPLSARLQKVQELFAARESNVSAAQPESPVTSTKPDIVNEGAPLVASPLISPIGLPPAPTPMPVVTPPTARSVQSPIWHKGLARTKPRSKPRVKPAASRRKSTAAGSKPTVRRSATKPFSPLAKRLVKEAAGRGGGRRRKSGR